MRIAAWPVLLLIAAVAHAACTPAAPGGVFHADEPVLWTAPPGSEWTVRNIDGHTVQVGRTSSDGSLNAGILPPGWYQLVTTDTATPFAVLCSPQRWKGHTESPVAIDIASAWREEMRNPETRQQALKIIDRLGIRWVRERINWAACQPEPNRYTFDWYDGIHADLSVHGLKIAQVNHSLPGWASDGRPHSATPMDLRTVYRFYREAAYRYRTTVQAWEIWNEPDNPGFYRDLSDRYAGIQKAGFLGVRDGSPRARVLSGSFCMNSMAFVRHLAESGTGHYFDVLNWHMYADPGEYNSQLQAYRRALGGARPDTRPAWMAEAGTFLAAGHGTDGRQLSESDARAQARFVAQSYVRSLAAGNERHFYFILFDYVENNNQMGLLRADLTPRPSLAAAAASAWMLDSARYAGPWRGAPKGVMAEMFVGPRPVLALWSAQSRVISVPAGQNTRAWDLYGAPLQAEASGGKLAVRIGPDPVYVTDPTIPMGKPKQPALKPHAAPSRIVLSAGADLPMDQSQDCYRLGADGNPPAPFDWTLDVYNLSDRPASGSLQIQPPAGWRIDTPTHRQITLLPMDRMRMTVRVTPGWPRGETRLVARFVSSVRGSQTALCISAFRTDYAALPVAARHTLDWLTPSGWTINKPADADLTITRQDDGLLFYTRFARAYWSGNWSYPYRQIDPILFSGMNAFELDVEGFLQGGDNHVRLLLVERNGGQWIAGVRSFVGRRRIVLPFSAFTRLTWVGQDTDNRLTLPDVTRVNLGVNTVEQQFRMVLRGVSLIKLRDR